MKINRIKNPELYQGRKKKDHYFEGWYFKAVSFDGLYTVAFIPGISINKLDPHAFIQVFVSKGENNDVELKTYYFRFPIQAFRDETSPFSIWIEKNHFSLENVKANLKNDDLQLSGSFEITNIQPIKKTLFSPNIMGPFAYLSFMECNHGIISMNHLVNGSLKYMNKTISFDNAKGYIEKDWGRSFPTKYIWIQSNHFENKDTSFMFSYATIPFGIFAFKGLIVNLLFEGKEYRFATYNGARIREKRILPNDVHFKIKKGKTILEVHAKSDKQIDLKSPKKGMMIEQIKEGLSGIVEIKLYHKSKLTYQDKGNHAGIEIMM